MLVRDVTDVPGATMPQGCEFLERLEAVAAAHADRPAVLTAGRDALTYRELLRAADALAADLADAGAGPERLVGVGLGRSAGFVAAVLGCWRAGAAFLPLDARWPADRLAFVVRDSWLSLAVAAGQTAAELGRLGVRVIESVRAPSVSAEPRSHTAPALTLGARTDPARLAYAIYTSGSTGRPKGVLVEHRGVVNLLDAQIPAFDLTPGSRSLWVLSPAFDASVSDVGTALLSGSTLCVEPDEDLRDPVRLTRLLHDREITHVDLPPALLRVLDPDAMTPGLRTVVIGGEPAAPEVVRRWARRVRVVNVYGPTEATVCTSLCACDPETWSEPLLGQPITGIRYQVLDGELLISGVGLARGYLNRPELTAAKFVTVDGERHYRTGDRVRLRPDGELVFLGRADRQFKLRGQLVEPDEVEARLLELPGVREAAAFRRSAAGRDVLVAAVVGDGALSPTTVRRHLARWLPPWIVPQHVEFVDALPRTGSGKVDYPALEIGPAVSQSLALPFPADGPEAVLAAVWSAVLGRPADVLCGFFEQGGDSLGVLEVTAAAHARGLTVPPGLIAVGRTIRELAAWLRTGATAGAMPAADLDADAARVLAALTLAERAAVLPSPLAGEGGGRRPPGEGSHAHGQSGAPDPSPPTPSPQGERGESPARSAGRPRTAILLTGATGFLGSWLLRELLAHTTAEVVCLVRDPARLPADPRIRPVVGDLERPRFGLSSAEWDDLTGRVGVVYHCAAAVNVVLPYDRLRTANLLGTAEVLRLLAAGRAKRLHYASTLSVFVSTDHNRGVLREADDLTATREVFGGYAQTKWAAERMLRLAGGRFGPVVHYRLGLVTADTRTGRGPGRDLLTLFLRGLARTGGYPAGVERDLFVDVTPVDYAAAAMARLSLADLADGTTFHVANPRSLSLAELLDAIRAAGVRLDPLTADEFHIRAAGLDPATAAACLGLCRSLTGAGYDRLRTTDLFQATGVTFDQANTLAGLAGSGIACPPPDPELLGKYVRAAIGDHHP
jgi:amino acid adenylation domain-containing protein/thioester reductase-like protein